MPCQDALPICTLMKRKSPFTALKALTGRCVDNVPGGYMRSGRGRLADSNHRGTLANEFRTVNSDGITSVCYLIEASEPQNPYPGQDITFARQGRLLWSPFIHQSSTPTTRNIKQVQFVEVKFLVAEGTAIYSWLYACRLAGPWNGFLVPGTNDGTYSAPNIPYGMTVRDGCRGALDPWGDEPCQFPNQFCKCTDVEAFSAWATFEITTRQEITPYSVIDWSTLRVRAAVTGPTGTYQSSSYGHLYLSTPGSYRCPTINNNYWNTWPHVTTEWATITVEAADGFYDWDTYGTLFSDDFIDGNGVLWKKMN